MGSASASLTMYLEPSKQLPIKEGKKGGEGNVDYFSLLILSDQDHVSTQSSSCPKENSMPMQRNKAKPDTNSAGESDAVM